MKKSLAEVRQEASFDWLLQAAEVDDLVTARRATPETAGSFAKIPGTVAPELAAALKRQGISQLYAHQAEAIRHACAGRHVVPVTSTNSGKSMSYSLPMLSEAVRNPVSRSLAIYPTKALAADQRVALESLVKDAELDIKVGAFDGDTPQAKRKWARENASVLLVNPDILHATILPSHSDWADFFKNLKYVAVDELHYWRGVLGSHVAHVLGRLRRVCEFYGSSPVFICTSATIANAREFAETMLGADVEVIDQSGAPQAPIDTVLIDPAQGDDGDKLAPQDDVAVSLVVEAITADTSIIVFVRTRRSVEVLVRKIRRMLERGRLPGGLVSGYRGGYQPKERRAIEAGLRNGKIRGVIATNALELGIDIGPLDVSVVVGWPGSVAGVQQMWGRAGRRGEPSLRVFVAGDDPVSQYVVRVPQWFWGQAPEAAYIAPDTPGIVLPQARCELYELSVSGGDCLPGLDAAHSEVLMKELERRGDAFMHGDTWRWMGFGSPAATVSIRGGMDQVQVFDEVGEVVGEVDIDAAISELHPKAVYQHGRQQVLIKKLDIKKRQAWGKRTRVNYYTKPTVVPTLYVEEEEKGRRDSGAMTVSWGPVNVHRKVVAYTKVSIETGQSLGGEPVDLKGRTLKTDGMWVLPDLDVVVRAAGAEPRKALEGVAHALRIVGSLMSMTDIRDLQGCVGAAPGAPNRSAVFLHEMVRGGTGVTTRLAERVPQLLETAMDLLDQCPCSVGCPNCTGPGGRERPLKPLVRRLLAGLHGGA